MLLAEDAFATKGRRHLLLEAGIRALSLSLFDALDIPGDPLSYDEISPVVWHTVAFWKKEDHVLFVWKKKIFCFQEKRTFFLQTKKIFFFLQTKKIFFLQKRKIVCLQKNNAQSQIPVVPGSIPGTTDTFFALVWTLFGVIWGPFGTLWDGLGMFSRFSFCRTFTFSQTCPTWIFPYVSTLN